MIAEPRLIADRYRLDERIGSGGMGVVWRAHDVRLNRTVAVKQLLLGPGQSPAEADESRARAMREGRIAARLQHPHAINVFDVALGPDVEGGQDSQPWLVMEYLPSRSLGDELARRGALPWREVAHIGRQIADALAEAHSKGIVHRDIKPGNVLLGDNGRVKITDFGIARATWDVTVTRTGVLAGTPAYFAPEVARGEAPDPASDVFSLGSTLYTAVEGVSPFGNDDNTLALLRSVAEGDVRPPEQAGPLTPVLMQLLRYDPAQRPVMAVTRDLLRRIVKSGNQTPRTETLVGVINDDAPAAPPDLPRASPPAPVAAAPPVPTATRAEISLPGPAEPRPGPPPIAPIRVDEGEDEGWAEAPAQTRTGHRPWWQRGRTLVGAVLLLLVVIGVVLVNALGGPADPPTAAQPSSTSSAQTSTTAPATSAPTTGAQSTTEPPLTTTPPPSAPGPAEFEQAVQEYYGLLPDQLDAAYAFLGPDVQAQASGRDGYESFWSQFSEVEAEDVQADGTTVTLTIVYTRPGGSVERERYVLEMGTAPDGRILILTSQIV